VDVLSPGADPHQRRCRVALPMDMRSTNGRRGGTRAGRRTGGGGAVVRSRRVGRRGAFATSKVSQPRPGGGAGLPRRAGDGGGGDRGRRAVAHAPAPTAAGAEGGPADSHGLTSASDDRCGEVMDGTPLQNRAPREAPMRGETGVMSRPRRVRRSQRRSVGRMTPQEDAR